MTDMPHARSRRGFTLIELLLVLVIIGVITAIAVPMFVESMRGNRRRTAARTIISAGRYARSMAVLHQRSMALVFDLDDGSFVVTVAGRPEAERRDADDAEPDAELEPDPASPPFDAIATTENAEAPEAPRFSAADMLTHSLEQIEIAYVEIRHEARCTEGTCSVVYQTNGRCTPYEIKVVDNEGEAIVIEVDALAAAETSGGRP